MESKPSLPRSNLKLIIAYDGTGFHGWQKTAMGPSIEGELQAVLEKITQQEIVLQAASRTDAGVHAEGQVVNCFVKECDLEELKLSLNRLLPDSIAVLDVEDMPLSFHPTLDAKSKEYHYHIRTGSFQYPHDRFRFWHCPAKEVDINAMQEAASHLVGTHDFSAFTWTRKKQDYQTLTRELTRLDVIALPDEKIRIEMEGKSFLFRMARTIAGTLMAVGQGRLKIEEVSNDRRTAGMTAPAHGLTLHRVVY